VRTLNAAELVDAWERGLSLPNAGRALLLLADACGESQDALSELPLGERDSRLLSLRERTFGPDFTSTAVCPQCGDQLELSFKAGDIRAEPPLQNVALGEFLSFCADGYRVRVRLPNGADMLELETGDNTAVIGAEPARLLLERCLVSAERDGEPVTTGLLSAAAVETIAARLAEADPQADVQLACTCPQCGTAWEAPFDIAGYFWTEIDSWARRMMVEVHILASAYGWREADILTMSAARRRAYLELLENE
jgi:hypothetical protein